MLANLPVPVLGCFLVFMCIAALLGLLQQSFEDSIGSIPFLNIRCLFLCSMDDCTMYV